MDCCIHFDNSTAIYNGGQIILGRVEINLRKVKSVKGVKVILKGKAYVRWTESGGSNKSKKIFSAKENYFKETIQAIEGINGETIELPVGQHIYPFKYMLPPRLPPSFESHYGHIRYSVKVILDRPWKLDQKVKSPFVIETQPDFIENPQTREPATLTMEKSFGFLMFKSEQPLTGILKVPYSGFICGQSIPLTLEINNPSNVAVKGIKFELNKIKKFIGDRPYHKEYVCSKTIWKSHIDCYVDSKTCKTITHQIDIPHFDVFYLADCWIIDIDYEIMIEVQTVGLHLNMIGKLPIFPMNNILLSNAGTNFYPVNNVSNNGTTSYPLDNNINAPEEKWSPINIGWNLPKN